jgi:hypothetical protein
MVKHPDSPPRRAEDSAQPTAAKDGRQQWATVPRFRARSTARPQEPPQ